MKIETLPQDNRTLQLTVEVEDERVQPALRSAARRISKNVRLPGFRPGKAPYETILRHYGETALYQEALEELGQKVYAEALEQEKIDAYSTGTLDDVQFKPMVLKFTVPLKPEVNLGDYRALRLPFTPPAVTDEALQDALEHMREHQAIVEPVERPAQMGDMVVLDVKAYINEGENPSDFLLGDKDVPLTLEENSDWPMPGFAQHVVGLAAGAEKKFDLAFPEDYSNDSLRGKLSHLEVTCKEVKSRSVPEWTDELAKELGEYESLADMREKVQKELERQAGREVEREYSDKVVEQVVEQAQVTYPPMILEREMDSTLQELDDRLRMQRLTLDDYLKIEKKTREEYRETIRPTAEKRLKRTLVLGEVINLEKLTVEGDEIERQINLYLQSFGNNAAQVRQALSSEQARVSMAMDLLMNKAVERLSALAKGEEIPLPADEEKPSEPAAEAAPQPTEAEPTPA